jgi:hypothetical protein
MARTAPFVAVIGDVVRAAFAIRQFAISAIAAFPAGSSSDVTVVRFVDRTIESRTAVGPVTT